MSHSDAATVASDAHPMPTACRCAMRTRPKVSSAEPVRKYGLCSLTDATSARAEPISNHATALAAKNSTGPRHDASMAARSDADLARACWESGDAVEETISTKTLAIACGQLFSA